MKKILSIIIISAISFSVTAQEKRKMKHDHGTKDQMHKGDRHHGKEMMKDLNFTDAQKSQLKANRKEYKTKMDQLKQNQNMSVKDFNQKKDALQKEQRTKMQSLLTPEQKTKMAERKAKHEQERSAMRNRHFEKMKTDLQLTDDQAARIKAQNESSHAKIKAIKDNESLSREEKRKQMEVIKESSKEQRKNILTAEQLKKMEERKKEMKNKDSKQTKK